MSRRPTAYSASTSEPMGGWQAWPDLNAGYKSSWRASPPTTTIEDMSSAHDKVVTRHVWCGRHSGSYGSGKDAGKPVEVRDLAVWRFEDDKVAKISTIQDQFALQKQIGYFPKGSMRRSPYLLAAGGGTRPLVRTLRRRVQVQC
jgi:hypothetical protein